MVRKEKQRRQEWRQSKEGSKVTITDVESLFMKLMKGANVEDCNFLANFERDDYTRIYDHKIRSVYNAESLPWTWCYILTRFNRKHILCGRSLPCADRARTCLDELGWKIEWKHHFLEKVSETLPFRVPYQRTAVFNQLPCPSLRSWLHRLKSAVFSGLQEDRSRGKSSTAQVNTFPMIRWVLRRMRDGGWTLFPNDKEPGFCFIRQSETKDTAISSLVPGSCEESHFLDLDWKLFDECMGPAPRSWRRLDASCAWLVSVMICSRRKKWRTPFHIK